MFFVSPKQINLQVPSSLSASDLNYESSSIVVTTATGSSDTVQVPLYPSAPAIFTVAASGCGLAAATNDAADATILLNSVSNSAAPGDYVTIYGTGLGLAGNQPDDGSPSAGPDTLQIVPGVWIDGQLLPALAYSGLAPTLVGVDQINLQIPLGTREGCAVPVAVQVGQLISPTVSLSIHAGRGQCVDPPVQSYGQLSLTKVIASGTSNDGVTENFTATLPSAPGLKQPVPETIPPAGSYLANAITPKPVSRSCQVAGYETLSAGPIQIQAVSTGASVIAPPLQQMDGVTYGQPLPAGFFAPGRYSIATSGASVAFQGNLSIGSPIQIRTDLRPGTKISSSQPLIIKWTGGDPGVLVKVTLISRLGTILSPYDYGYADAASGSFTFQPLCTDIVCSFGLPNSDNAEIDVELSSPPSGQREFTARGITGIVQASWTERWVFGGLVLTD